MRQQALVAFLLVLGSIAAGGDEKAVNLHPTIANHLERLGTAAVRASARLIEGEAVVRTLFPKGSPIRGRAILYSDPEATRTVLLLPSASYRGEHFFARAERADVGFSLPGRRSDLGVFFFGNDPLLREGLFGGVLNARWPLADLAARGGRIKGSGAKSVDGKPVREIQYTLRERGSDVDVRMQFDPETWRHVGTIYRRTVAPPQVGEITASSRQQDARYVLSERFSDFERHHGLDLPMKWVVDFSYEVGERTVTWRWEVDVDRVTVGNVADPGPPPTR